MADELDKNLDEKDPQLVPVSRVKDLSDKVKTTSEERDTLIKQKADVEKERDFYQNFSDIVATQPAAKDHKDEILSKVKSGYTVEDATLSTLAKAGKLTSSTPAPVKESPAGGSADTSITIKASKSVSDMTQAERKAALMEAEMRGDISTN